MLLSDNSVSYESDNKSFIFRDNRTSYALKTAFLGIFALIRAKTPYIWVHNFFTQISS